MASGPDERSGGASVPRGDHVRLVSRLLLAQAVTTVAIGLPFSRRQLSTIVFTLTVAAVLVGLSLLARSGARTAWLVVFGFESAFFLYGLSRFVTARYAGGTLFALLTVGALLRPEAARAYGIRWGKAGARAPSALTDSGAEALRGEAFGEETTLGGHPVS